MKQLARNRLPWLLGSIAFLASCTMPVIDSGSVGQDRKWFNPTLPIHLQASLFDQESSFCSKAAAKWHPIPDIAFAPGLVRQVNDISNASVDGRNLTNTPSLAHGISVGGGFRQPAADRGMGPRFRTDRERRDYYQCLKSLGWQGVSKTWDGTPPALNETFGINARVMELQRRGFSHPFVARDRILMIDLANSTGSESAVMLKVAGAEFSGSNPVTFCEFSISRSFEGRRLSGFCGDVEVAQTSIGLGSPFDHWLKQYFPNF